MFTGAKAWTRDVPATDIPADLNEPQPPSGPINLAMLVQGTFKAPDGAPPKWPNAPEGSDEAAPAPIASKPGNLLVIGTARPFLDDQIADPSNGSVAWSGLLLKNAVDALSLSEDLLKLTAREAVERPIREVERGTVVLYEVLMIGLAPALILVLGILRLLARKRRQEQVFAPSSGGAA